MGRYWSGAASYHRLISTYANQTTTHGIRRISSSKFPGRRIFWICIFLTSLGACCYHCSYLITLYSKNPKVTITEEKDADAVEFPAITVCNLNVIKMSFADSYFHITEDVSSSNASKKLCVGSEQELLFQSAIDLSDTWLNLGLTKDNLTAFGHKASDLIVQCTYNSKDCFNSTNFRTVITNVTSPLFGLCHVISIKDKNSNKPASVKKGGTTNGIRLTLNIERELYWNLISSEYGVRILVHPQGTYPTLQRGGIIVSPGRSVHIGVKRRVSQLLPGWEGTCTESFQNSRLMEKMAELGLDFDISDTKYTYERCNTLCQNAMLFNSCRCLDEQPKATMKTIWKFCSPCIRKEADCRTKILREFTESGNMCDEICLPACSSIRYEISLSKADWPNLIHQQFVMNRSRDQWLNLPHAIGLMDFPFDDKEGEEIAKEFVNDTFFRENLLRVHLFIEDMLYMSIQERYSYTLPKLMADLGGCLGLYLGVSVISIIELIELFGNASIVCMCRMKNHSNIHSSGDRTGSGSKRRRRNKTVNSIEHPYSSNFGTSLGFFKRKKNQRDDADTSKPPFSIFDPYFRHENISRTNARIRRF